MAANVYRIPERIAKPPPAPAPIIEDDVEHVNCAYGVENPYVLVQLSPPVPVMVSVAVSVWVLIVTVIVFVLGFHPAGH